MLLALLIVLASAGIVGHVERNADGNIQDFGDAIWWAMTTITTVGYGDTFPTTALGRGVGVFLMLSGITLFGVITANLAAFLTESAGNDDAREAESAALGEQLQILTAEVRQLREQIESGKD